MPNSRKQINEVSSIPIVAQEVATMLSSYEPYITSWVTTNGPLLMNLAAGVMAGYYTLGMLADMVLSIGSKQISPEEKLEMIEKRIMSLEQEQKSRYLQENKQMIKEVYNFMKAERLVEGFDRRTVLRLIMEALSAEEVNAMISAGRSGDKRVIRKIMKQYHPDLIKNKGGSEEEQQKAQDTYQQAVKFEAYFTDDDNKDNFDTPKIWPTDIQDIMKNAGVTGRPAANQQDQGDQKDVSPEVVQNVGEFLKKTQEKYHNLYEQMQQVIKKFTEEPAAFFADEQFVNNLVSIAQSLNEQKGEGLGVELKDGDLKGNIQKIIAGLEEIRKQLLEALSRKAQTAKERPKADQKQLNENKELYAKAKALLKREKSFYKEANTAVESYMKDDGDDNIKKILASFKKRKRFADFNEDIEKVQDLMQAVEEQRKGAQSVVNKFRAGKGLSVAEFKKDIEAIGNYTQAYEALQQSIPSEKQDSKPMPLLPQIIDKVDDNQPLTIVDKSGEDVLEITKQEADATYDILSAADKFVRIYELLFQLINKKISLDKLPLQKKIDLSKPPQQKRIDLTKIPFVKISLDKSPIKTSDDDPVDDTTPDEEEETQGDSDGPMLNGEEVSKLYAEHLQFAFDDFEENFLNVPLLTVQSDMFAKLVSSLQKFKEEVDAKAIAANVEAGGKGKQEVPDNKPEQNKGTESSSDNFISTNESLISKIERILLERREIEFDSEDMQLFKTEYKELLKVAKMLESVMNKIKSAKDLETFGGSKIEQQVRKIASIAQESIGKVHDVVSNELKQDVQSGETLKEQEEEKPPEPFEAGDADTNKQKRQQRKEKFNDKVATVKKAYERIVNQLTLLNQFVDQSSGKTDAVDGTDFFNYINVSQSTLDSIVQYFPSQSPFGKKLPKGMSPDNYVKKIRSKMKTMVRDIIDIVRQLQSTVKKANITEGAIKDLTDEQNVDKFASLLSKISKELQDFFDAPSKIGKVFAQRAATVENEKTAAAMNEKGESAIKSGQAEKPEYKDKKDSGKPIVSHSQAITDLASREKVLKDIFKQLSNQPGGMKEVQTIGGKAFTSALVVLLNDFPNDKEQVKEEVGPTVNSPEGPGFKVFGLDKEKLTMINKLIKLDKTGGLSIFMYALKKDATGAKYLKSLLDQKLKGISFNLDLGQIRKFYMDKEEEEQEIQEKLQKKLETIIEHYINHRKQ